jgi:D-apiose dehydrogenase
MARPLRGAVIGCGFFAENHLNAWRDLSPKVEIVAVCDRDRSRAEAARERFGAAAAYGDARSMLEAERLDFVDIVTTVQTHRPLVELVAAHELPVICQKPFANDMTEARAMVDACAGAGVPLMIHENFRWQNALMAVKGIIGAGQIGRPFFGRINFRHAYDIYATQPYLATEQRLAIQDLGIHLLDLARFYLGEATRLYCRTDRINPAVRGEDAVVVLLDHANGAKSVIDFSFYTHTEPDPFPQTLVRIEGERGTVELHEGYRLVLTGHGSREERHVEPAVPMWGRRPWHVIQESVVNIQRHWVECLRSGTEPATSGRDNLETLRLVEAAYASAASGQAVEMGA